MGEILAEQILQDCNEYSVPDDGEGPQGLKASGRPEKVDGDWAATWNTVYAPYQWYGCWPDGSHVVKNHTPDYSINPSTQWGPEAEKVYGDDWDRVAQREHVRGSES